MSDRLATDLEGAAFKHGVEQDFWRLVDRIDDILYVSISAVDEFWYVISLACEDYGREPIEGRFVDANTRACVASAWPQGNTVFSGWIKCDPNNLFICWDQDRGGIAHHADWRQRRAWERTSNPLVGYLEHIHRLLWLPRYGYSKRRNPS